jgi:Arc/MetJ family transcription regulator
MGKRTSLILDPELLQQAADVLGAKSATETVRTALQRVVRQAALESLAQWEFPDDFMDELKKMREPRKFDFE